MKLFLSHVSNEAPLAIVLKDWIEKAFGGQFEIFVSSNIKDLPAGNQWLRSLEGALDSSNVLLVLCSPNSATKPWVMFESGGAWVKKIPIIPICHSGQRRNNLPSPLSFFQGLEVDSPRFVHDLMQSLSRQLNLSVSTAIDQKLMLKEIKAALRKIKMPATTDDSEVPIPKPGKPFVLDKKDKAILKKIATSNNEDCTWRKLAKSFRMRQNDMDVHLRYLKLHRFITKKTVRDGEPWYQTTKTGLNYLIRHKLI